MPIEVRVDVEHVLVAYRMSTPGAGLHQTDRRPGDVGNGAGGRLVHRSPSHGTRYRRRLQRRRLGGGGRHHLVTTGLLLLLLLRLMSGAATDDS